MAPGRYRRRRRIRRYKRRYYRKRRGFKRPLVNAGSRSGVRVKLRSDFTQTMTVSAGNLTSGVLAISPWVSRTSTDPTVAGVLPGMLSKGSSVHNGPIFALYANLYEQCRLEYMSVKCICVTPIGGAAQNSATFTTCWDRDYTYQECAEQQASSDHIVASPSSRVITAVNNQVAKFKRSIWPSDLFERSSWMNTDIKRNEQIRICNGPDPDEDYIVVASDVMAAWHVDNYRSIGTFSPAFFMVFSVPSAPSQGQSSSVTLRFEVTYYVQFRNPRFGQASGVGSAKTLTYRDEPVSVDELPAKSSSSARMVDDDVPFDDEMELDDVPPPTPLHAVKRSGAARPAAETAERDLDDDDDEDLDIPPLSSPSKIGNAVGGTLAGVCRLVAMTGTFNGARRNTRQGSPARRLVEMADAACKLIRLGRSRADAVGIIGQQYGLRPGQFEREVNEVIDAYNDAQEARGLRGLEAQDEL